MKRIKTYKSGLRLIVDTNLKNTVSFKFVVNTGSYHEEESEFGFAHFMEHLMFKSSKKLSHEEFLEKFNFYGTTASASTGAYLTQFYFSCLKENFENLLELYSQVIEDGEINPELFEKEKQVIIEEMHTREANHGRFLDYAMDEVYYKNTPLSHRILGYEEGIKNATLEAVNNFKSKHYKGNNVIITIAGGISFSKAEKLLKKYYKSYFEGNAKPTERVYFANEQQIAKPTLVVERDIPQGIVFIKFKSVERGHRLEFAQNLYNKILGYSLGSRLSKEIRERLGFVYAINSAYSYFFEAGDFFIEMAIQPKNIKEALQATRKVLKDVAENGVTDDELQAAKNIVRTNIAHDSEKYTNSGKNSKNYWELYFNKKQKTNKQILKGVKSITKEQVQEFAKLINDSAEFLVAGIGHNINEEDLKAFYENK